MKDAITSTWSMLVVAWRTSPSKIVLALVLMLAGGAAWPLLAVALRAGFDAVIDGDVRAATLAAVAIAVTAIGALILQHFAYVPYAEVAEIATVDLEIELMQLANGSARLEHHERADFADRIGVLQKELGSFNEGMIGLMATLSLALSMTITGILLASLSPWLLLLPLAAFPAVWASRRAQQALDDAKSESASDIRQAEHLFRLATSAAPAKEIRVLGLQEELRRRNSRLWRQTEDVLARAELRATLIGAAGQLVFATAYVVAVLLIVRQAVAGQHRVGDVVLVITLAAQVNQQVTTGLEMLRKLQQMAQGMTRLRWLRTLIASQAPPPADAPLPERMLTGIEFKGVSFAYPGTERPVLSGVDLLLPAGSTVAIVGENGAGKTTLVKLLCRFYEATAGQILLDGTDITRMPLEQWRQRIAAGFQDFTRFELPAQHTVGLGNLPDLDDRPAVLGALERARGGDVLERLEEGMDTHLGKSWAEGTELSGGQWQKLALGRAMMRETPLLLVLDEPTAALDAEAEHLLFERYAENARRVGRETGAITLLVSHRFSTVRMADLILVVDDGRICEAADHATLVAAGGLYAELYALQAAAYG